MNSVLSKKPSNVTLTEYFKTLNVFEKRELLNELSDAKSYNDKAVKSFTPYFLVVLVCSILGLMISVTPASLLVFGVMTSVMTFFLVKTAKTSIQFKIVIDHLTKNM
jgi:hypothetical protein